MVYTELFDKVVENKSQVLKFLGFNKNRQAPKIIEKKIDEEMKIFSEFADVEYHYNIFERDDIQYADILYTVGNRLENKINEYLSKSEAMRAMILDKIGVVLLDEIKDKIIQDIYHNHNFYVIEEMYPSETKDFPLEKQKEIYENIKGSKNITINEYYQLNPVKSVALRLVLGEKPKFINKCNHCTSKCEGKMSDEETMYRFFKQKAKIYTKELYKKNKISELYDDNIKDIDVWANDYFKKTSRKGISKRHFEWIDSILELKVIKLGELQFEITKEMEIKEIVEKPIFINVHIREGSDLSEVKCEESYDMAIEYYRKYYDFSNVVFICCSWLINKKLNNILPNDSNIIKFQNKYKELFVYENEIQAEERVFGEFLEDKTDYIEETSLQKKLKKELIKNEKYGTALGYFIKEI